MHNTNEHPCMSPHSSVYMQRTGELLLEIQQVAYPSTARSHYTLYAEKLLVSADEVITVIEGFAMSLEKDDVMMEEHPGLLHPLSDEVTTPRALKS